MSRVLTIAGVAVLYGLTLLGNYAFLAFFALTCSEGPDKPRICDAVDEGGGWGPPVVVLVVLFLPSLVATAGVGVGLFTRRLEPAVLGLVGAVVTAPVVWVIALSIG